MKQIFYFLIVIVILVSSCKRKQAVWDTENSVPILDDTLTLNQFVQDSILTIDASNYYELAIDRTVFELKLSDFVSLPDTTVRHSYALSTSGFNVPPGASFVNNTQTHEIDLGDVELKKVRIQSGGIDISVLNPIETKTFFTVELPTVSKNGVTLSQLFTAPAGTNANPGVVNGYVDLSGYEMDLRGLDMSSFNLIPSSLLVQSDPEGPTVTINNQDSVKFLFTMQDIKLDYARGYFGSQLISDTVVANLEALNRIESGLIDLPASSLELELVNGLKLNAKLELTHLKNINNQGNTVNMSHAVFGDWLTINSATGNEYTLNPSELSILFDGGNSNLENYLENHGATNEIGFKLQINPWGNVSGGFDEIFPQSSLKVNVKGNMPLNVGLTDFILKDTFDFSLKQDITKTHITSGTIWLKAMNAFPIGGNVTLYLLDVNGAAIATLTSVSDVKSSVYGTVINGIQQKQSMLEFEIPASIVDQLSSISQLSVQLKLNTPNASSGTSEQIQIPANAFFGFKVGAKLKVETRL